MGVSRDLPQTQAAAASMRTILRTIAGHRGVQSAAALWLVATALVLWLAQGLLPFDRPAVARFPFAWQVAAPSITLIEIVVLMALVFLLTRRRLIPDMAGRAPHYQLALRETLILIGYAAMGQLHKCPTQSAIE
jgi:hypothetical protein